MYIYASRCTGGKEIEELGSMFSADLYSLPFSYFKGANKPSLEGLKQSP